MPLASYTGWNARHPEIGAPGELSFGNDQNTKPGDNTKGARFMVRLPAIDH
jgi:hypothetical protein